MGPTWALNAGDPRFLRGAGPGFTPASKGTDMDMPLHPPNEACRLAALHELHILDTPPEERFDRITRLARRLFDVPIALVSLVDADRQWFKSREGLEATETPRAVSFCSHAILQDHILVIPDAKLDPRFCDNPLVVGEPRVRFYAGCPLKSPDGYPLGTLCIIDRKSRELSAEDLDALKDLAGAVEQQLTHAHVAMVDELTGLTNRRGLIVIGDYMVGLSKRSKIPVCVLFFDLDGFKSINDVHGHATGDRALLEFSRALVSAFRKSDVVSRLGGDEFCVVMSDALESQAASPLARLDAALSHAGKGQPFKINYSVGSITYDPEQHATIASLLESADRKMYADKRVKLEPVAGHSVSHTPAG